MVRKYCNISLPESLAKEVDKVVGKRGYSSRCEFAKDAIRRLLDKK